MDHDPIQVGPEEGGRSQLREHDWMEEREMEIREKERRGEQLSHSEKMSRAIDEGVQ